MYYKEEEFKPYYESFITDLKNLLRIPSVLDKYDKNNIEYPFGKPIRESLDFMLDLAKKDGFKTENIDNYCGFIEYGEGEKILLILCHLDVVPASGSWTNPPFDPIIKDGRLYARGSSDDKGPLMATYYAIKQLRDEGFKPSCKIRFFFGCDEESGSRCLERYIEKYGECDLGFSPDADFPCIYAEKGISTEEIKGTILDNALVSFKSGTATNVVPDEASATLNGLNLEKEFNEYLKSNNLKGEYNNNTYKVFGKSAHGSTPEEGLNAATSLAVFLNKYIDNEFLDIMSLLHNDFYGEKLGISFIDNEMGKVSNNVGMINLSNHEYQILCNIRYPKGFDLNKSIEVMNKNLSKYNVTVKCLGFSDLHYVPKYSHLVQALLKAYQKHTNDFSEPISIGGGTYARDFKNAVAFGCMFPGELSSMHMPDESCDISNLIKSLYIIKDAIINLCD